MADTQSQNNYSGILTERRTDKLIQEKVEVKQVVQKNVRKKRKRKSRDGSNRKLNYRFKPQNICDSD